MTRKYSLTWRFAATVFLLQAALIAAVLGLALPYAHEAAERRFEARNAVFVTILSDVSRTALLRQEYYPLQQFLGRIQADPQVEHILVADDRGRVVASTRPAEVGLPRPPAPSAPHLVRREARISTVAGDLGSLVITFSRADMQQEEERTLLAGIGVAAAGLVLSAFLSLTLGALLTRRLVTLTRTAQRLADGDLGVQADISGRDEVAELSRTFNAMAHQVGSTITMLRDRERDLSETTARFRAVFNASVDAVGVKKEGIHVLCNPAYARIFGCASADDLIGRPFLEFIAPEQRPVVQDYINRRIRGEDAPKRYETRGLRCDGTAFDLEVHVSTFDLADGRYSVVILRDVTERNRAEEDRRKAEAELREMEARYRTIFEKSSDGILIIDRDGTFLAFNEAAHTQLGYTREEFGRLRLADIAAGQTPDQIAATMQEVLREGKAEFEVKHRTKTNEDRDVAVIAQAITLFGRTVFHTIWRDVTRRKKQAEEMIKMEKLESLGLLAGGIAHDFNNLLTAIIGNVSLAKLDAAPGEACFQRLSEAEAACLRARDLTRQLLTFAKGGGPVKRLASVAAVVSEAAGFALRGSATRARLDISPDLWPAMIDEGQISQVVHNLIINADQAMPDGGTVTVTARNVFLQNGDVPLLAAGPYVKVSVSDHGVGIPPEYLSRVFDPFFTTKQKGSGLGLATSYSIVRGHDGQINAASQPGAGATFTFYLPAAPGGELPTQLSPEPVPRGSGRVLVMDDEASVRNVAREMLLRLGYEAALAADGAEAIACYRAACDEGRPFDAVIMDLTIPGGMGGREAVAKLREIDPGIRAIVSSGYSNDATLADFRRYGFSGVVIKPYRLKDLADVLSAVIRS